MEDEKVNEKINKIHKMIDEYKDINRIDSILDFLEKNERSLYDYISIRFENIYFIDHTIKKMNIVDLFVLSIKNYWKALEKGLQPKSKYIDSWTELKYNDNDLDIEIYERGALFNPEEIAFMIFQIWAGNIKKPEDK